MRRTLVLGSAVALVALVAAVTFVARSPVTQPTKGEPLPGRRAAAPDSGPFALAAQGANVVDGTVGPTGAVDPTRMQAPGGRRRMISRRLVYDLARRLDVEPGAVWSALRQVRHRALARAVERGELTAGQRRAVEHCMDDDGACDRARVRSAFRGLRASITTRTWDDRQAELLGDLARALELRRTRVRSAVRDEVEAQLTVARTFGAISDHARTLLLTCFDVPDHCDLAGLRREIRPLGRGRR